MRITPKNIILFVVLALGFSNYVLYEANKNTADYFAYWVYFIMSLIILSLIAFLALRNFFVIGFLFLTFLVESIPVFPLLKEYQNAIIGMVVISFLILTILVGAINRRN